MALLGLSQTGRQRLGIPLSAIAATTVGRCSMSAQAATIGRHLLIRATAAARTTCTSTLAMSTPQTTTIAATGALCVVSENHINYRFMEFSPVPSTGL